MRKLLFAQAAVLAVTMAGPAIAADLPLKSEAPYVPRASPGPAVISAAVSVAALATKDITDPVQLVQDSLIGGPVDHRRHHGEPVADRRRDRRPDRLRLPVRSLLGGRHRRRRLGLDHEGQQQIVSLPAGTPDTRAGAGQDRLSCQRDRAARLRVRPRAALRQGRLRHGGDKYNVSGVTTIGAAVPFNFHGLDNRYRLDRGRRRGMGVHAVIGPSISNTITMSSDTKTIADVRCGSTCCSGVVDVKQNIQVVKVGLNFHIWGSGW